MKKYLFLTFALLLAPLSVQAVDCYPVGVEPQHIDMDGEPFNLSNVMKYTLRTDRGVTGEYTIEDSKPVEGAVTVFCVDRAEHYFGASVTIHDMEGKESEANFVIIFPTTVPMPGESAYPRAPGFACTGAGCGN